MRRTSHAKADIIAAVVLALVAAVRHLSRRHDAEDSARHPLSADRRAARARRARCRNRPNRSRSIPTAAALDAKLRANPVTARSGRELGDDRTRCRRRGWSAAPTSWPGASTTTRYLIRLDPIRAFVVRTYMMLGGDIGDTLLINAPPAQPINAAELAQILASPKNCRPATRSSSSARGSRGAFPPIARPAVTSLSRHAGRHPLHLARARAMRRNRSRRSRRSPRNSRTARCSPPRSPRCRASSRTSIASSARSVSSLLENGGTIAVYDIDTHKFLPRPMGVIAVPDDPPRRAAFEEFVAKVRQGESLGIHIRHG